MQGSIPGTSDARVFAVGRPLFALVQLMAIHRFAGKLLIAELTLVGQFRDCLLHGQVTSGGALGDLDATVGASGRLITESASTMNSRG